MISFEKLVGSRANFLVLGLLLAGCALVPGTDGPCLRWSGPSSLPTPVGTTEQGGPSGEAAVLGCHHGRVYGVAFSPDGTLLASSGNQDGTVRLYDVASRREIAVLDGPEGLLLEVAISPDDRMVAVASRKEKLRVWDMQRRAVLADIDTDDTPWSIAFNPDGSLLAVVWAGETRLYDTRSFQEVKSLATRGGAIAFLPDGRVAIMDGFNGQPLLWDFAKDDLRELEPLNRSAYPIAVDPSGRWLASAGEEAVYLWDLTTGSLVRNLEGHTDYINDVAFSPDGSLLASSSGKSMSDTMAATDFTVRLWDVATGESVAVLNGHAAQSIMIAFHPDGSLLATASYDGTVRLWPVPQP